MEKTPNNPKSDSHFSQTPKGLRLHLGIFGRTNVGKSSFLNMVAAQSVAITSPIPGTTTDVVEKAMELLPLGPVVFLDTAGVDDCSSLAEKRLEKTRKVFERSDVVLLVTEPNQWTEFEEGVLNEAAQRKIPSLVIVNKTDLAAPSEDFLKKIQERTGKVLLCSSIAEATRDQSVNELKKLLIQAVPDDFLNPPALIGDLLPPGGVVVMMVPIDLEAPKGRLILPQVQAIRDTLDNDAAAIVVKEREFRAILENLKRPPDLVVCDSQVVLKMTGETPAQVKCTTFSILFSRLKGDLNEMARGAATIHRLKTGDRVLVAEACTHHALEDDIGRVKIPRWLRQFTGLDLQMDTYSGHDFPKNLSEYKLVIHCGSCVLTRREMLFRIQEAKRAGVSITNYGMAISVLQGVIERTLAPFPAALEAYREKEKSVLTEV